jgi:hypothetical protein
MPGLVAHVRLSRHSRPTGGIRRPAGAAATAGAIAAAVLAAGCSPSAAGLPATSGPQAITTAAQHAARITSVTAAISVRVSGPAAVTTRGTIREQLRPAPLLSMHLNSALGGVQTAVSVIVTRHAAYLHLGVLGRMLAKPWLKVPLAGAQSGRSTFGQLLRSLTFSDPLAQARLLLGVKHARRVGTADIGGVPTAEYAATYTPGAALAGLSPALRRELGPQLSSIKGRVHLDIWIDAQHRVRQLTETGRVAGENVTTTITYTGYNKPVHIAVPPASQVQAISGLGQLGG